MSIVICKNIPGYGFCAVKNIDKNYRPSVKITKSHRENVERLMIWDEVSKYTEGINEFGVAVISCPHGNSDEYREVKKILSTEKKYYSPSGFVIRKSLLKSNCYDVMQSIIKSGLDGKTIVFDKENCLFLDMSLKNNEKQYTLKEIDNTYPHVVFSNYSNQDGDKFDITCKRISRCETKLSMVSSPEELLDICSDYENDSCESLIVRTSKKFSPSVFKTTSQIMIVPSQKTMYYRPLYGKAVYDMNLLNNTESKTYFELVSTRKLITLMNDEC